MLSTVFSCLLLALVAFTAFTTAKPAPGEPRPVVLQKKWYNWNGADLQVQKKWYNWNGADLDIQKKWYDWQGVSNAEKREEKRSSHAFERIPVDQEQIVSFYDPFLRRL